MKLEPFELKADDDPRKKADSQQRLVSFRSFKLEDVRDRERSGRSGVGGVTTTSTTETLPNGCAN